MADSPSADLWKAVKHPRMRPWLAVAAEIPATFATHHYWGDNPVAAVGLTVAAGVLTAATWWAGEGTKAPRRVHATASTAVGTSYLVVGTLAGPFQPALVSALVIGGSVAAGSWNIRQALRVNPDAKTAGQGVEQGVLTKAIGAAKVALRGQPKIEPNKVTVPLQLSAGEVTTDDLGNRIKHIAGELGVSPTAIRVIPDPDRADQATLIIVPQDMLKKSTPWPGPSAPGQSITEPIVIGLYEDGQPAHLWFPSGDGRNATHFLTAGMNGSGKSAGVSIGITEAMTRRDVVVWGVDPSKGMQTFAPFLPYLDWVEMSLSGGEAMIAALSQVITARADEMGRNGFKNWTPEVFDRLGMPYMIVWIEEAAKFFREGTEMEGLVMEARSAGISVIISLQRPSSTSMPTDVREQLGGVLCFGVKGATTADMALPDDVRDAGARPEAWENRRPGYAYLVAPGVDEDRYSTPLRTYYADDDQMAGVLAIAPRPTLDPVTTAAAGDAYANRKQYAADTPLTSIDTEETDMADETTALDRAVERDILDGVDEDDDGSPDPDVDPGKEIPPVTQVWAFGQQPQADPGTEELTTEQAYEQVMQLLEEFRNDGRETVGPRDFRPHLGRGQRIDRSRAWLSPILADLADEGLHLQDTDKPGEYKLLHPALTPA